MCTSCCSPPPPAPRTLSVLPPAPGLTSLEPGRRSGHGATPVPFSSALPPSRHPRCRHGRSHPATQRPPAGLRTARTLASTQGHPPPAALHVGPHASSAGSADAQLHGFTKKSPIGLGELPRGNQDAGMERTRLRPRTARSDTCGGRGSRPAPHGPLWLRGL